MIRLSEEKVMYLHNILIEQTGGNPSIRDRGLLDSALEGAYQTFGGVELYPTIEEKGARLGYSLISNHAFIDGNKRIGMLVMFVFLEINGVRLNPTNEEFARVGLAVASGEMKYDELLLWVQSSRI